MLLGRVHTSLHMVRFDRLYYDRWPHSLVQRADGRVFTGRAGGPRLRQEGDRKECSLTRRDETRGTALLAPHRHKRRANTGMSGVLDVSTRQGMHHRRTGQAFTHPSTHPITHTIRPVSTEKHLRIPSQRYARRNTLLGRERNAIEVTSVTNQSFDRQAIKSNQTGPVC